MRQIVGARQCPQRVLHPHEKYYISKGSLLNLGCCTSKQEVPSSKHERSRFFHHHSPFDLERWCSEGEVSCSDLELWCSEGEVSCSELGTPSNLLEHPSSELQRCTFEVQLPSYFLQRCFLLLGLPRFTSEPLPHFVNYCL
ncbi:hypothetical protein NIES2098_43830 [Calothrix sp. NIES-2098]|nr:hypothetical protein NIES2098_43830 [Calothrix sp. NIES-2098]